MNFCPNCGTRLIGQARFCSSCGGAIGTPSNPTEESLALGRATQPLPGDPVSTLLHLLEEHGWEPDGEASGGLDLVEQAHRYAQVSTVVRISPTPITSTPMRPPRSTPPEIAGRNTGRPAAGGNGPSRPSWS